MCFLTYTVANHDKEPTFLTLTELLKHAAVLRQRNTLVV